MLELEEFKLKQTKLNGDEIKTKNTVFLDDFKVKEN